MKELLPSFLVLTPEQQAEEARVQEIRRASFGRGHLTEEERMIARGAQIEEIARENIRTMEEAREEGRNVSKRGGANLDMLEVEHERLAEALAMQGRYEEAAKTHPKKRRAEDFREIQEAIERPDELCECPDGETSPRRSLKNIYSRKHGRVVPLVLCDRCKTLNATPK